MEFLAIFIIAPLIWSTGISDSVESDEVAAPRPSSLARIEDRQGRLVVIPPQDRTLTMEVIERRGAVSGRAPASSSRLVEVTVSAP